MWRTPMYYQRRIRLTFFKIIIKTTKKVLLMKKSLLLLGLLISNSVFSAAQVNYLNIDGDAVHFSTAEAKTATSPSCAVAATNERFAFSLKTDAGRAMYSLLVTAMAAKQALTIESAQDCADVTGIERVAGLSIAPAVVSTVPTPKRFYLYTGNGTTKIGPIINVESAGSRMFYISATDNTRFQLHVWSHGSNAYFEENNCVGEAYLASSTTPFHKAFYLGGRYIKATNTRKNILIKSRAINSGECIAASGSTNAYVSEPYTDPLCGEYPCIIKEE